MIVNAAVLFVSVCVADVCSRCRSRCRGARVLFLVLKMAMSRIDSHVIDLDGRNGDFPSPPTGIRAHVSIHPQTHARALHLRWRHRHERRSRQSARRHRFPAVLPRRRTSPPIAQPHAHGPTHRLASSTTHSAGRASSRTNETWTRTYAHHHCHHRTLSLSLSVHVCAFADALAWRGCRRS